MSTGISPKTENTALSICLWNNR